jgi:putative ABC transport system permease protein
MFLYNLKLGIKSIGRNPIMSSLMVLAIALGIGACMTTVTVFYMMDANPNTAKNDVLYVVQPDSWSPEESYDDNDEPPPQLTYNDAMALMTDKKGLRQSAMVKNNQIIQPEDSTQVPFYAAGRANFKDFFQMFSTTFKYGSAWTDADDANSLNVVVLNESLNEQVFGGEDSVGKQINMGNKFYTVVGVLNKFNPQPRYYDLTNENFADAAEFFMPFNTMITHKIRRDGNTSCWENSGPTYEEFLNSRCIWIQFWVELESASQRQQYLEYLNAYIDEKYHPENYPRKVNSKIRNIQEWLDFNQVVGDDAQVQLGLAFMFLIVCLLNTLGLLLAKFLGKSPEIGLRRALGATRSVLFTQHIIESGLIGVIGGLGGLLMAFLGLYAVNNLYDGFDELATMDWLMVSLTILLSIIATVLAGLYPTWRACHVAPAGQLKTQ